jgi:hypothetical protein
VSLRRLLLLIAQRRGDLVDTFLAVARVERGPGNSGSYGGLEVSPRSRDISCLPCSPAGLNVQVYVGREVAGTLGAGDSRIQAGSIDLRASAMLS